MSLYGNVFLSVNMHIKHRTGGSMLKDGDLSLTYNITKHSKRF